MALRTILLRKRLTEKEKDRAALQLADRKSVV